MQILFCASEVAPFAKTGGLADVAGSLPESLRKLGCDVRIFMPLYRSVREKAPALNLVAHQIAVSVGIHIYHVHFWESSTESGIPIYFLEKDEFYDRTYLYGSPVRGDYEDNAERFITFCLAARPLCAAIGWYPSILHIHDWQAGLVAAHFQLNWALRSEILPHSSRFYYPQYCLSGDLPRQFFQPDQSSAWRLVNAGNRILGTMQFP